jgi:hypothetical protein
MYCILPLLHDTLASAPALSDITLDTPLQTSVVCSCGKDLSIEQRPNVWVTKQQDPLDYDHTPRLHSVSCT